MIFFISLFFFSLAAICNAVMDKLQFHFYTSIFQDKNPRFWNPELSWRYAKIVPFTKYKIDAWHLAKSLMIIFVACASAVLILEVEDGAWWCLPVALVMYGATWILT